MCAKSEVVQLISIIIACLATHREGLLRRGSDGRRGVGSLVRESYVQRGVADGKV